LCRIKSKISLIILANSFEFKTTEVRIFITEWRIGSWLYSLLVACANFAPSVEAIWLSKLRSAQWRATTLLSKSSGLCLVELASVWTTALVLSPRRSHLLFITVYIIRLLRYSLYGSLLPARLKLSLCYWATAVREESLNII